MKRTLILGSALAALLLSGCQTIKEEHQNYLGRDVALTNVVGNVWRIDAKWPGTVATNQLADHVLEVARRHCAKNSKGMLPLRGASENGTKDHSKPAYVWLEFRCQAGVDYRPEYKGLTGSFTPDELLDLNDSHSGRR